MNSLGALEGPDVVIEVLGPWCISLHVKDFRIQRVPHMMGFVVEGTPAGQGRLDIPSLLASIEQHGRDPNVILELWPPPEPELAATIAKEEQWMQESVTCFRRYLPD